ncbi:unnamed protein product [Notodromas monacha]|uniref:cGMP-dependent protein kinase interacting domain-containing protein n=1 Tax=Notodromas monacha TaxID=399045 RepID=A0A7R9BQZ2_9CRUS|nr:unnamed protein product [Notodromas monacha]CAG0919151.1 unnamed protein product [Notodromas monacha]
MSYNHHFGGSSSGNFYGSTYGSSLKPFSASSSSYHHRSTSPMGSRSALGGNYASGHTSSSLTSAYSSTPYGSSYASPSTSYSSPVSASYGSPAVSSYSSPSYSPSPSSSSYGAYSSKLHRSASGRSYHRPATTMLGGYLASASSAGNLGGGAMTRASSVSSLASRVSEGYGSSPNIADRGLNRGGSRYGNSGAASSPASVAGDSRPASRASENGEVDYKKLYEESLLENELLKDKLKKTEEDLTDARLQIDKVLQLVSKERAPNRNALSDVDKRERRALERKLSEMEEELKLLQKLRAENEKLKAENRALTRVVSKLTSGSLQFPPTSPSPGSPEHPVGKPPQFPVPQSP